MSNPIPKKPANPKLIACVVVLALPILLLIFTFMPRGSSSNTEPTSSPETSQPMGGYCLTIMRYLNDSLNVMAGAGTTTTEADILPVLKENGEKLTQGFDSSMVDTQENVNLLYSAGEALLKIRVDIVNGDDVQTDANSFTAKYKKINAICSAN